jgi:sec-independent protein translocase protein TatB
VPLNLSFTHIMVVLVVALIVLGPERLPDAARSVARVIRDLRSMSAGLQNEVRETFGEFAEPISDLVSSVTGGIAAVTAAPVEAEASTPPPEASVAVSPLGKPPPLAAAIPALGDSQGPMAPGPPLPELPALDGAPAPGTFMPGPHERT